MEGDCRRTKIKSRATGMKELEDPGSSSKYGVSREWRWSGRRASYTQVPTGQRVRTMEDRNEDENHLSEFQPSVPAERHCRQCFCG